MPVRLSLELPRSLSLSINREPLNQPTNHLSPLDLSRRNPFVMVLETDSLLKVAEVLSTRWGVHRVNVFNKDGQLVNIVTQSSLVNFLAHHLSGLGGVVDKTVGDLKLGTAPVVTVEATAKTSEAFNALRQHNISAVPVVNSLAGGGIIANIRFARCDGARARCAPP